MQHPLQYPLSLDFEMAFLMPTLPLQISVRDGTGREILYVRQKLLKLRDKIKIFSDSSQSQELYEVNADRILDWSARFIFTDPQGRTVGALQRHGTPSIWRATYDIQDASGRDLFGIQEEQPWLKVIGYFVEHTFVAAFSGLLFSPTYGLQRVATGQTDLRITKRRRPVSLTFTVDNLAGPLPEHEEVATVLGILIMVLHERRRE